MEGVQETDVFHLSVWKFINLNNKDMAESEFESLVSALGGEPEESAVAILERTTIDTSKVLPNGCSLLRIAALRGHIKCDTFGKPKSQPRGRSSGRRRQWPRSVLGSTFTRHPY